MRLPVHAAALAGTVPPAVAAQEAFALAIHDAFIVAAIVCAVGIVTSAVRGRAVGMPVPGAPAREDATA